MAGQFVSNAQAQQIIIEPSAPSSTGLFSSGNGTPQINIATPNSGVSQNKFSNFNVGNDGLILNNSQSGGTSVIGGSVNGNTNLATSGSATVILNEVTGTGASTLTGTTEVFGGRAAVIIANPNGIGCNGCAFINTNRSTLTTSAPTVTGSDIEFTVSQGTINIGRGGFNTEGAADLVGRHVIIDGPVTAETDLAISGGSQKYNYNTATSSAYASPNARKGPFAVDASEFGALNAGQIRIYGNENGLGVNAYGNLNSAGDLRLTSKGDLFYGNVQSGGVGEINANGAIRQYGDADFAGDVTVSGGSFTLYRDRKLNADGNVTIDVNDFVVVVGEITANDITIDSAQTITNNGFVLASGELRIIAGDNIDNVREIATEYDVYYDPVIQQYLEAYQALLLSGGEDAAFAAEMLTRAAAHEVIEEYVLRGATLLGENITLEANLDIDLDALEGAPETDESGDVNNIGGAIIATRNLTIRAGENIINEFVQTRKRLDAEDGCESEDCGYRVNFHAGEILAGGNIALDAGLNIENRASNIGAAGAIVANAGQDIINSLKASQFIAEGSDETVTVVAHSVSSSQSCNKNGCTTNYSIYSYDYDTDLFVHDEGSVIAPGQIVTLNGDIDLYAGRDFVSIGSEVSSGGDLNIIAQEEVIATSYSALEEDFEYYRAPIASTGCGKNGCSSSSGIGTFTTEDTGLITSATNLIGRTVNIAANDDIALLGVRILAEQDLNIQSTNGSILVDSTDLPDEVIGAEFAEVNFLELDGDAAELLFRDASLTQTFEQYIADNPVLAAVDTLSRVEDAGQIRGVVKNVGLQGGQSIFAENLAAGIEALRAQVDAVIALINTTSAADLVDLDNQVSVYYTGFGSDLADLEAQFNLSQTDVDQITQDRLDDEQVQFDADMQGLLDAHNAQLASIEATFAVNQYTTVTTTHTSCSKNGCSSWTSTSTIEDPTAIAVRDASLAQISLDYNSSTSLLTGEHQLANAQILVDTANEFDQATITTAIDALEADLQAQAAVFDSQKTALFDHLNDQITDALQLAQTVRDHEVQLTELSETAIAEGTALFGEKNAAVSLAKFGFEDQSIAHNPMVDLADDYNVNQNSIPLGLVSSGADADFQTITDQYAAAEFDLTTSTNNAAGQLSYVDTHYQDGTWVRLHHDADSSVGWNTYTDYYNADGDVIARRTNNDDGMAVEQFYSPADGENWEEYTKIYNASGQIVQETTQFDVDNSEVTNYVYAASGDLQNATTVYADGRSKSILYDQASANTWQEVVYEYADNGAATNTFYKYDDGTITHRIDDWELTNTWEYQDRVFDVDGKLTRITLFHDDGSHESSNYDPGNTESWQSYSNTYNAAGALSTTTYFYDDNRWTNFTYDTDGTEAWSITVENYSAGGNLTSRTLEHDDGTAQIISFDPANASPWSTITHDRDASGTLTETGRVDDTDTTIADTNYDALFNATKWRFGNDNALNQLARTPRSVVYAEQDLSLTSGQFELVDVTDPETGEVTQQTRLTGGEDIYVTGVTTVSAGGDIAVNAGRRIGLLGAVNTNFRLTENAHTAFEQIGENLQLGTLLRDPYANEVEIQLDENGDPLLDEEGNTIAIVSEDADGEASIEFGAQTQSYRLTNTVLNTGGDLSLNSGGDILNFGGSLVSGDNVFVVAETDIRNEALRHNFTLTRDDGCFGSACGRLGHDYKAAEILAGSGAILAAGGDVKNYGGAIGAAGAILIQAEGSIINDALTSQYLYHYINTSSFFGLNRRKELLYRAIIQDANISSQFGSITLDAGNDIKNLASLISAGGDITLDAGGDIELYARSEEVHNYVKRRGFGFLSYSSETTRFNEFGTALSQLEGNAIYASAGNNLTGIGASLLSATDIRLDAGNNLTFDAQQNLRYSETEGWSFGLSFPGSNIIQALVEGGGWEAALDAYIGSNPVLAAVHQLATANNGDQTRSGLIALAITIPQTLINAEQYSGQNNVSRTEALAAQFNPFSGGPLDPNVGWRTALAAGESPSAASFLEGITFRFSAYESRREWTESHISRLTAGQDLILSSGNDLVLVGGTVASAAQNADLTATNDILVSALADTQSSTSSSWGASIGFAGGGVTFGGYASEASSDATLYTNAGLTAGERLDIWSGRDTTFAGANVAATDIAIYTGRDLVVQSRQNVATSESSGWNASVTVGPTGITGFSFGGSQADANRVYTDTPTTIIAENTLDIYTEGTTYLLGAVLDSKTGDLTLNTGDFIFQDYIDADESESISGGIKIGLDGNGVSSLGTTGFGYAYTDIDARTYATVGTGEITVRDVADGEAFDFALLNRDVDLVQEILSNESFEIDLPAIELSAWIEHIQEATEFLEGLAEEASIGDRENINIELTSLFDQLEREYGADGGFDGDEDNDGVPDIFDKYPGVNDNDIIDPGLGSELIGGGGGISKAGLIRIIRTINRLTRIREVQRLFKRSEPANGITIGARTVLHDGSTDGAKVFNGVSTAEVKSYFTKLTGQPLPAPRTIVIGENNNVQLYTIQSPNGNFNLRSDSSSGVGRWTIDVPKGVAGTRRNAELKFK